MDIDDITAEGLLVNESELAEIVKKMKSEQVDGLFFPHCNFGTEDLVAKAAKALNKPVLLWGPRDDAPLADGLRTRDTQCGLLDVYKRQDYTTKMSSLIASNSAPDIAYIFTTDVYKWADEGLFVEIYEMLDNDPDYSYEDFIPQAFLEYEPGKAAGRRIATETINLYYNKDLFDEAGVDYLLSLIHI